MASQGPKVEKVTKGGKEKKPPKEKKPREKKVKENARANPEEQEEQGAQTKADKGRGKAEKQERKAEEKAEKAKRKAAVKEEKAQKKAAAKEERAAKKQAKSEKGKAVKIARDGDEAKPAGKKKKLVLAAVAVVLVLLIAVSVFFLIRMLRGDSKETTASLPDSSISAPAPVQAAVADGETSSQEPETSKDEEKEAQAPSKQEKGKEAPGKKEEKEEKEASASKSSSAETPSDEPAPDTSASSAPEDEASQSKEAAAQAVEGSAGTAGIAAMLGSGAVPVDQRDITDETPTDQPKPGQIVAQTAKPDGERETSKPADASQPKKPESKPEKGTALTPPTETQEVPDFKFSEESLHLPPFTYNAVNALEAAVHRDVGEFLAKKDDRPGTQITSVVVGGTIRQADGSLRVLAYAWGSRYAIAENTLFDYGNLVGPCAIDYTVGAGGYTLQKITLARAGDAFETSVREFCGDETKVADKMVNQAYDLELRGQMLRNVSSYISRNGIPVDFFRASGQVYNRDGSIYLPPQAESAPEEAAESAESGESGDSLQDQYKVIQDMPE